LILADVNILLHAFRTDCDLHNICAPWLESVVEGTEPFAVSPQVLSSVFRIATNPKAFDDPNELSEVVAFAHTLLDQPHCRVVHPGPRHWAIFCDLCRHTNASGNLIPDAWFAALAIEHGCEWITEDRDYKKFPGLRWRSLRELRRSFQ
jgi:toxin-antitoxin system PIN domain toxin